MRLPFQVRHCRSLAAILALAGLATLPVRAQESPAMPGQMRNQLNQAQASSPSAQSDAPQSAPANAPAPAGQHAKSRSHKAQTGKPGAASAAAPAMNSLPTSRRDPFAPLLASEHPGGGTPENLPPGKAGLMVDTLRLDGIVSGPNGMIAIVENPQDRVYFLREGDKLYDGSVTHIALDAVSFHQTGADAFGKPVDRELTKRLNPSSTGDSQ
jgi:hypothetical protein